MSDWQDVAARDQLDPDFPLGVEVAGKQIGIYVVGDVVHAVSDVCPHAYALLSQGFVENGTVECPLHGAQFDLATGKCLSDITDENLTCFPVRVQDGRVFIQIVQV
jgi:nitrite reductase/ring-hydroxylating ferredoxin subunit